MSFMWIKSQLDICETHGICQKFTSEIAEEAVKHLPTGPRTKKEMPKRLLSIAKAPEFLQLLEDPPSAAKRYACLSHRWGEIEGPTTTKGNMHARKARISWDTLPKTFQDAIKFAQALQVYYIWIDSLCIVQDDDHDWHREASNMASIYSNGYFTIAATRSHDSRGGCFNTPSAWRKEYKLSPQETVLGSLHAVCVRPAISHIGFDASTSRQQTWPLLTRGWVFQERLLSKRVIHFCEDEIVFECMQSTQCFCGHLSGQTGPSGSSKETAKSLVGNWKRTFAYDFAQWLKWSWIVSQYSALDLTFDTDLLPAIGALAERLRPHKSLRYAAGLWHNDDGESNRECWDLCWYVDQLPGSAGRSRRAVNNAPTWSWASVVGAVSFPKTFPDEFKPAILDMTCELESENNPFGPVKGGRMVVRGDVLDCGMRFDSNLERYSFTSTAEVEHQFPFFADHPSLHDWSSSTPPPRIFCLKLGKTKPSPRLRNIRFIGLILRATELGGGELERIGLADVSISEKIASRFLPSRAGRWFIGGPESGFEQTITIV
jgi:hypothetical protein